MHLLTLANRKTEKGLKHGWLTGVMHLAPARRSGRNVCPFASDGCIKGCLNTSGFGRYKNVQDARIARTVLFFEDRKAFLSILEGEIHSLIIRAKNKGLRLAIRLNGTSDLPWENYGIIEKFPTVIFYDYTKVPTRMHRYIQGDFPKNYHLTFSRSESNEWLAQGIAKLGGNVAVVFNERPKKFWGIRVIDGDCNDLRFTDPRGVIVGLSAKGRAKWDKTGFVVKVA